MASWRVAKSLLHLRAQINAAVPDRSVESDGTIGDASHASRASDHNPWVRDNRNQPVVTAMDITHDPARGVNSYIIADQLRATKDPRIKYVISNRRIMGDEEFARRNKCSAWTWINYSGKNPHDHHVHVSVEDVQKKYDDESDWPIVVPTPRSGTPTKQRPNLRRGNRGNDVRYLQQLLGISADGEFGQQTEAAVKAFQKAEGMAVDGVVGPYTWRALLEGNSP